MKEARYFSAQPESVVQCWLCPHHCTIADGRTGFCRVRMNDGGTLYSLVWGRSIAASVDPVEKKPFFHLLPGSLSFSIATVGCNMRCDFCQNSDISQHQARAGDVPGEDLPPRQVVEAARAQGCASVFLYYTEPTIFLELHRHGALARRPGSLNSSSPKAYINPEIVAHRARRAHRGANIDLKSFSDDLYRGLCSAGSPGPQGDRGHFKRASGSRSHLVIRRERLAAGAPGDRALHSRHEPGHPLAREPVLPPLPLSRGPVHPGGDTGPGQGDRPGRGAQLCIHRQRRRPCRRTHPLPGLRRNRHRQEGVLRGRNGNARRQMQPLRPKHIREDPMKNQNYVKSWMPRRLTSRKRCRDRGPRHHRGVFRGSGRQGKRGSRCPEKEGRLNPNWPTNSSRDGRSFRPVSTRWSRTTGSISGFCPRSRPSARQRSTSRAWPARQPGSTSWRTGARPWPYAGRAGRL